MIIRPSVRWNISGGAGRAASGSRGGSGAGVPSGRGASTDDDALMQIAGRTLSGTELNRPRSGSLRRPGELVRPLMPIIKRGGGSGGGDSGAPAAASGSRAPSGCASPRARDAATWTFSQPLSQVASSTYFPEEDPWPDGVAPLDASTLRQLSAQRLALRQLSWNNSGLGIAAGIPGLGSRPAATSAAPGCATSTAPGADGAGASAAAAAPGAAAAGAAAAPPRRFVSVRCLHLGSYRFKGSDVVDMVWVTTAALAARGGQLPREEAKGKGRRVAERSGVADSALVSLADVLPSLREGFLEEAAAAGTAAGAPGAADSGGSGTDEERVSEYVAWLAREMTRRRRFGGLGFR
jgi:hypothetical protein